MMQVHPTVLAGLKDYYQPEGWKVVAAMILCSKMLLLNSPSGYAFALLVLWCGAAASDGTSCTMDVWLRTLVSIVQRVPLLVPLTNLLT